MNTDTQSVAIRDLERSIELLEALVAAHPDRVEFAQELQES